MCSAELKGEWAGGGRMAHAERSQMQMAGVIAHDRSIRRMRHVEAAGVAYDGHVRERSVRGSTGEVREREERGSVRPDSIRSAPVKAERMGGNRAGMESSPATDVETRAALGRSRQAECCLGFASTK